MAKLNNKAFNEWEKEWERKLNFWFSPIGTEFQLNLIAQGYEDRLEIILLPLLASGFIVLSAIKKLKDKNNLK